MTYYNRDNLFNLPPIPKGQQGNQGATGAKGDEWTFGNSKDWLPGDVGYTNLPGLTGLTNEGNKYWGGVLTKNGKIYCIPRNATNVLVIDTIGDTYYYPPGLTGLIGVDKWVGGVLAPNGKIYCVPFKYSSVLVIDTLTDTGNTNIQGLTGYFGDDKWVGGVLAPNGLIYCVPYDYNNVLVIDPINNIGNTSIPGLTNLLSTTFSKEKWWGGVLGQNGYIYCAPSRNATSVLVIDTLNNIGYTNLSGLTNLGIGYKWACGALSNDGNVYFIPYSSNYILKINTFTNTIMPGLTGLTNESGKYIGGVLAPNGDIYCIPYSSNNVMKIDTLTDIAYTSLPGLTGFTGSNKFAGGVLANNGSIYCVPTNSDYILKIKTGLPKYPNWMLDPYFNKF